jgi:hypothetical protein
MPGGSHPLFSVRSIPMLRRSLIALGLVGAMVATSEAAVVKSLIIRCVDQQETSPDDVFLAGTRDGQPVPWSKDFQEGMSRDHSINMTTDGSLVLDEKSLGELKFAKTLQIVVKEKDVTADETLGTINITPTDGQKKVVFKGEGFEYHVEYSVEQ